MGNFKQKHGVRYDLRVLRVKHQDLTALRYNPAIADIVIEFRDVRKATWDSIGACLALAHNTAPPTPSSLKNWYNRRQKELAS